MLELQIRLLTAWHTTTSAVRRRVEPSGDRGEVTATTALTVLLVTAAIVAGTIIASRITANAHNVPEP